MPTAVCKAAEAGLRGRNDGALHGNEQSDRAQHFRGGTHQAKRARHSGYASWLTCYAPGVRLLAGGDDRQAQSPALRLQIMAACYSAIQKWEPRISLTAIAFERSESDGTLYVDITGTRPSSDRSFSLTISLS